MPNLADLCFWKEVKPDRIKVKSFKHKSSDVELEKELDGDTCVACDGKSVECYFYSPKQTKKRIDYEVLYEERK